MTHDELQLVLTERLSDMADQVANLLCAGEYETAQVLQDSINDLLQWADTESYEFLYIPSNFGSEVE